MVRSIANRFLHTVSSIGVSESIDLPNGMGSYGYLGAAPPKGDRAHRYFFAVHALEVEHLDLPHGKRTAASLVAATAVPYTIARAVLMGTHKR